MTNATTEEHAAAVRKGRLLERVTVSWNFVEAFVSVGLGIFTSSALLLGFGLDAIVEASSGLILLWRLQHGEKGEEREKLAHQLVGISLLVLAAFVSYKAIETLVTHTEPDESIYGIIVASVSIVIMPMLARAKRKVAAVLQSNALHADSKQTDICAYLSVIVIVGLGLNYLFGWWWADPIAALCMVPIIGYEGVQALRGHGCHCHGTVGEECGSNAVG